MKPAEGRDMRKPTPASIDADCGLIRIRHRRGNGGRQNELRRRRVQINANQAGAYWSLR
jgi:hypothetical protein